MSTFSSSRGIRCRRPPTAPAARVAGRRAAACFSVAALGSSHWRSGWRGCSARCDGDDRLGRLVSGLRGGSGRPVAEQRGELPPRHVEPGERATWSCRTERARELRGFRPTVDLNMAESTWNRPSVPVGRSSAGSLGEAHRVTDVPKLAQSQHSVEERQPAHPEREQSTLTVKPLSDAQVAHGVLGDDLDGMEEVTLVDLEDLLSAEPAVQLRVTCGGGAAGVHEYHADEGLASVVTESDWCVRLTSTATFLRHDVST